MAPESSSLKPYNEVLSSLLQTVGDFGNWEDQINTMSGRILELEVEAESKNETISTQNETIFTQNETILTQNETISTQNKTISTLRSDSSKHEKMKEWGTKIHSLLTRMKNMDVLATLADIDQIRQVETSGPSGTTHGLYKVVGNLFEMVPELQQLLTTFPEVVNSSDKTSFDNKDKVTKETPPKVTPPKETPPKETPVKPSGSKNNGESPSVTTQELSPGLTADDVDENILKLLTLEHDFSDSFDTPNI